jgi:hypothetical protein
LVGSRDHRTQFWKGAIQGPFHQSLVQIGPVASEELIKMWKVNGRTTNDGRSVVTIAHLTLPFGSGELKNYSNKFLHNFHLSKSRFTCLGLQVSGLTWRLPELYMVCFLCLFWSELYMVCFLFVLLIFARVYFFLWPHVYPSTTITFTQLIKRSHNELLLVTCLTGQVIKMIDKWIK